MQKLCNAWRWVSALFIAAPLAMLSVNAQPNSTAVPGITEPVLDSTMAFPVTGVVTKRYFDEGAPVKKGDVIIELDKHLEELDVQRREYAMQLAKAELDRLQSLARKNTISVSQEEIDKKQAEFQIARVELELAREMVRRRQLISPVDGYIAQFFKEVGEACDQERAPVVRVVDTTRCYFVADCELRVWQKLTPDQKMKLQFDAREGTIASEGQIAYIAPVVEPASGLLRVKVLFENPDLRIRPGIAGRMITE